MCFRPAEANAAVACPSCGKKINYTNRVLPKKCPFCKTPLEEVAVSATPGSPKAPGAPSAPSAPTIPGAPKPPSA